MTLILHSGVVNNIFFGRLTFFQRTVYSFHFTTLFRTSDKMHTKFSGMADGRKNKNPAIEPLRLRAFTTDKSKVQRLDTDITNMTAESLNF